ncbi:MAG: DUF554 domain-containing protein [Flavobacteriales bacterium]|jgi:uncharacterized protein|nr:DUF554 domain-containing protein [Flavobacteriales bacterium]MBT6745866.1 DUF554 domain-containing protein [Flavobacteriales bacterium]
MILGSIINAITIVTGSILGVFLSNGISERFNKIIFQALGLFSIFLGVSLATETDNNFMIMSLAVIIGGLIGELLRIEERIEIISNKLKSKINNSNPKFTEGLITSTMLFSIGSMAILGPLNEALNGDRTLVLTKSIMDGVSAIALASAFGRGVIYSAIPVLIIQGSIGLSSSFLEPVLSPELISELTAVGGLLIIGIGISILEIKKIKVINLIPALLMIIPLYYLNVFIGG